MTALNRMPDHGEHLSLAGLVEQMTSELERTGRIDASRWAGTYREWQTLIHELTPLLEQLGEIGRMPGLRARRHGHLDAS